MREKEQVRVCATSSGSAKIIIKSAGQSRRRWPNVRPANGARCCVDLVCALQAVRRRRRWLATCVSAHVCQATPGETPTLTLTASERRRRREVKVRAAARTRARASTCVCARADAGTAAVPVRVARRVRYGKAAAQPLVRRTSPSLSLSPLVDSAATRSETTEKLCRERVLVVGKRAGCAHAHTRLFSRPCALGGVAVCMRNGIGIDDCVYVCGADTSSGNGGGVSGGSGTGKSSSGSSSNGANQSTGT